MLNPYTHIIRGLSGWWQESGARHYIIYWHVYIISPGDHTYRGGYDKKMLGGLYMVLGAQCRERVSPDNHRSAVRGYK